jgi:membrane protein DedA with SNARE-associated domain
MVYIVVLTVLGIMGKNDFATEIKIMVVSAVISGVLGAITGFWLGTSFSSSRKTELLQK